MMSVREGRAVVALSIASRMASQDISHEIAFLFLLFCGLKPGQKRSLSQMLAFFGFSSYTSGVPVETTRSLLARGATNVFVEVPY